ncbi:AraC family transcriptional regulator [Aurantiacibacter xanthus]|uniref:AraC family transcriptional regulator n=1 Tax=Aurantiacibacter xanthus TaxID=1784712 RepID=UPI00174C37E7|nr:AraC family transcriptional regulator [Aurantiacibacter xanthus]
MSSYLGAMQISVRDRMAFDAHFASRTFGRNRISRLRAGYQHVTRLPSRKPRGHGQFNLLYLTRGEIDMRSHVRSGLFGAGEWMLLDNQRGYDFASSEDCECFALYFDEAWVRQQLPSIELAMQRQTSASAEWGSALQSGLSAIAGNFGRATDPLHDYVAFEQIPRLLGLACGVYNERTSVYQDDRFGQVLAIVREEFADPDLGLDAVAGRIGLSRRQLSNVLRANGTTCGREIQRARLDEARRLLASPRCGSLSIGDISASVGLLDAAHFAKLFKCCFGETPSEFRARRAQEQD